ncbi:MAG: vWA domain-containing protein [Gammaproteobacteria bacterium]
MMQRFSNTPTRLMLMVLLVSFAGLLHAASKPLLMEGKKTLYQRVLSVPEARLYQESNETGASAIVIPFSVLYVYEKGDDWLKVGYDSFGQIAGWVKREKAIVWNQALTVSFKDPQDIQRVMLFNSKDDLEKLVTSYDREGYQALYDAIVNDEPPPDSPVIAIQPEAHLEIRDNFYLVPIKQHEDVYLGNEQARMLEIASVPLDDAGDASQLKGMNSGRSYRSGIHFVIDSTQSMGPYIDRTREAVKKVYSAIERQGLTNQVSFGLTAYRDNTGQVPELEYLTRRFVSLEQGTNVEQFLQRVNDLNPSQVSSRDFREDAYAGIKSAIEDSDWDKFDARYVVLITDAGPRESHDSLSSTRLSAQALRQLAYDKGVSIWVLHLRTPSVAANHEQAEELYKQLSYFPGIGDFYYGVSLGQVDEFGNVLEVLANQITQQVLATTNGVPPLPLPEQQGEVQTQLAQLQDRVAKLGNALRMRYIQRESGQPLPSVFDAWMVDRDFINPERSAVDVRVLLTRDQLSDLKNVMQQVLELAQEGVLSPQSFIDDLQSLAATVSRDPSSVAGSTSGAGANLADMGYMREYIEDLPYTGEVMDLTLESWEEWSAKVQIEFMHRLESKINYYQALHDHTDLWVTPGGGPVNGNSVFPVALDLLP